MQHFHITRIWRGTIENLSRHVGLTHLLGEIGILHGVEARAGITISEEKIPQAFCLCLALQALHDIGLAAGELPAIANVYITVILGLDWADFFIYKLFNFRQQRRNICADSKVHHCSPI